MKNRKWILAIAIVIAVIVAIVYSFDTYGRLLLIRWTMNMDLPGWLQALIWGW
ncbi:MAG: hypothetical protein PUK18_02560 [Firmicutes bacterium]|nr:hypothetical protein [Bacillota bacterium]MDY6159322.1 hypothetical protein [Candidatus Faecousia sp.]